LLQPLPRNLITHITIQGTATLILDTATRRTVTQHTAQARYHWRSYIDLHVRCAEDADFANPIEPSVQGGSKIAAAITSAVTQPDFAAV
jgi:hypothetical protein